MASLEVMICTYGAAGICRVAEHSHPHVEGVRYLVGWQMPQGEEAPEVPPELMRDDFTIYRHESAGLSKNRNYILSRASAPILLFSDDDVDYTADGLKGVIDAFDSHPDCDLLTFRYDTDVPWKKYLAEERSIWSGIRRYYPICIEIAFRREAVQERIALDERFGVKAPVPAGEEDVFIEDCRRAGLRGRFVPLTICRHAGSSTFEREDGLERHIPVKAAVNARIFTYTWPLRMLLHSFRDARSRRTLRFMPRYVKLWLDGVKKFRRL